MKINFRANLVSAVVKQSQKGNVYVAYSFVDENGGTLGCMGRDASLVQNLQRFAPYDVSAELTLGKFPKCDVVSLSLAK